MSRIFFLGALVVSGPSCAAFRYVIRSHGENDMSFMGVSLFSLSLWGCCAGVMLFSLAFLSFVAWMFAP
jgi:hypothetical protein